MLDFPKWKIWAVTLPILIGILLAIPSMMSKSQAAQLPAQADEGFPDGYTLEYLEKGETPEQLLERLRIKHADTQHVVK